jgi:hypothetical protein
VTTKKLKKWVPIAELVSAAAVIITLAFLVVGMRENTNALQAQTYQELMRDINTWRSSIRDSATAITLDQLEEIMANGSSEEIGVIRITFLELWGIYEAAFFARERGVLGDNEWGRFAVMICFQRRGPVEQALWGAEHGGLPPLTRLLTPAFIEYVDKECN